VRYKRPKLSTTARQAHQQVQWYLIMRYLYIWSNHIGKTCYGITSNVENRKRKYEGHCGHEVNFDHVYTGPANHIEDLEDRIKSEFWDHLFGTGTGRYEWINENVATDQILQWIAWEIENTYENLITKVDATSNI